MRITQPVTASDAFELVERMVALWPEPHIGLATVEAFRDMLTRLDDLDAARAAVQKVIETEYTWPPFAAIYHAYRFEQFRRPVTPESELEAWRAARDEER